MARAPRDMLGTNIDQTMFLPQLLCRAEACTRQLFPLQAVINGTSAYPSQRTNSRRTHRGVIAVLSAGSPGLVGSFQPRSPQCGGIDHTCKRLGGLPGGAVPGVKCDMEADGANPAGKSNINIKTSSYFCKQREWPSGGFSKWGCGASDHM